MKNGKTPTQADFDEANVLAANLQQNLPAEFTLPARLSLNGDPLFPDLHFKADPEIPGLFKAKVDPDFMMGREPRSDKVRIKRIGNGNQNE